MGLFELIFGNTLHGRTTVSPAVESVIKADLEKVDQLLKLGGPSNYKQALLIADRSLDTALKELISGETMGERLKNAKDKFDRILYNKLWEAHKMRNSMVHESGFDVPYYVVQKSVDDLKSGLRVLGVRI